MEQCKYAISLSTGGLQHMFGDLGALDLAKAAGCTCVDLDLTRYSAHKEGSLYYGADKNKVEKHFMEVRRHADELGIRIGQTHGRIEAYKKDQEWNEKEYLGFCMDALATEILGAPICVVHEVHLGLDAAPEDQRAYNMRQFRNFLPVAKKHGILLSGETFGDTTTTDGRNGLDFFGSEKELLGFFDQMAAEGWGEDVCLCMDTGHTNKATRFGEPKPEEFIRHAGKWIKCLHLNDNDTLTDQHKVPRSGTVNWQEVMLALREIGYSGTFNMELAITNFGKRKETVLAHAALAVRTMEELVLTYFE